MDPLTAISFAGTILQFIDFSSKLVAGAYEVYRSASGTTSDNVYLSTIVGDLQVLTDEMDSDLLGHTKHEKALKALAVQCGQLADKLLQILEQLKVSHSSSLWKSLRVKWASMRKSDELQSIERRLGDYRSQILLRLNLMLGLEIRDQQSSIKMQLDRIQREGETISTESAVRLSQIWDEILQALERSTMKKKQNQPAIPQLPPKQQPQSDRASPLPATTLLPQQELPDIKHSLDVLSVMVTSMPVENRILQSIYFESMYHREDNIHDSSMGTLEWLLEDDIFADEVSDTQEDASSMSSEDDGDAISIIRDVDGLEELYEEERYKRAAARTSLLKWLGTGSGIFHISGRAGAGKSTLMKFLCNRDKTEKRLMDWAGDKKLVVARFFFWKAGDDLQKSLQGLYRLLLFEVLKKCPELIPRVFASQWQLLRNPMPMGAIKNTIYRPIDIQKAFQVLTHHNRFPNHRFYFFIDGLDEYDAHSEDHIQLGEALRIWTNSDDIKICVSSRPHVEFHLAFSDSPDHRIHLHELTSHDIYIHSRQMIEKVGDLGDLQHDYVSLVSDVVRMSGGVFLWAWLVVRSLLPGIRRRDSICTLKNTLNTIPTELDELYTNFLDSAHVGTGSEMRPLGAGVRVWSRDILMFVNCPFFSLFDWVDGSTAAFRSSLDTVMRKVEMIYPIGGYLGASFTEL